MAVLRRQVRVPEAEISPVKLPYNNLAAVASHDSGANLNFTYETRTDANGQIIYPRERKGIGSLSVLGGASTQVGRGIASWRKSSATTDSLFCALDDTSNTKLYLNSGGTLTVQQISAADINLTTGKDVYFVPVAAFDGATTTESLFTFTGFDDVRKYNGTTWSVSTAGAPLSGSNTRGMYAAVYRNMLMVARTQNNPNRLWISDVGKPETFTAGNQLDFPGEITGLFVFENFLLVFTRNSIHMLAGSQPADIVVSSAHRGVVTKGLGTGTDSHKSIARIGGWVYFWNRDRVFRFNTGVIEEVAYAKGRATLQDVVSTNSSLFAGIAYEGRYYISLVYSSGSVNNRVLIYDPRPEVDDWVLHASPKVQSFTTYRATQDATPSLVFVSNDNTSRTQKVYTYDSTTTPSDVWDGSTTNTITFQYTSEHLSFGDSHLIKKPRYIWFNTKAIGVAPITIQAAADRGSYSNLVIFNMTAGGFILGTSKLGQAKLGAPSLSETTVKRIPLRASRTLSVRAYTTQAVAQAEFYDFDLQLIPKKLKTK
jgi:hypothetical protein